ncbi:MAG: hypothetical protein A2700_01480 [Candidatus Blackburnbacteria bacterium RIFCSPHIGHO2_01_FULL_44_64]|nr:MAG: hypothetical protein A2700_01480 [Candidatus Blackburnbacteria bacterium RIFCSPHIGHO2_01_FULL_44_64]OGY14187.1 MAG: hypothetical protein A3A62_01465 [Candidatus Blackburnbacteria bacterium RIFCSPLOWO2_01_FULL_44_43]HXK35541.1 phospholipid carrier-dependent glycosyltransferase [Candidatus Paceibacterota bacterium]
MRKYWPILLILAVSALTHFAYFGYPDQTVFDEVHFGKFISGYFTGQYFFDIHPPLGKLLISGIGYVSGFKPGFSFADIGDPFPDKQYLWLRLLPTLAGMLLPLVLYGIARQLGWRRKSALLVGLLTALESALLVQSRFILLDSLLLLFGFSALYFYLRFYNAPHRSRGLLYAGILAALAGSIKWTGFSFLGLIVVVELWRIYRRPFTEATAAHWLIHRTKIILISLLCLIVIPVAIYFGIFAVHFKLLPNSGPGDAFMSPEFQSGLVGNPYQESLDQAQDKPNLIGKFIELNREMYRSNQNLSATHPYGSQWYSWPLMARPIYYWNNDEPGTSRHIYLLGNPLIWWASTVGMIFILLQFIQAIWKKNLAFGLFLIVFGFLVNWLPFAAIGRVMFLYHYFIALLFAILGLGYLAQEHKIGRWPLAACVILAAITFVYFSPLSYGLPAPTAKTDQLMWFENWR